MNAKYITAIAVTVAAISSATTALFIHYGETETLLPLVTEQSLPTDSSHTQEKESARLLKNVLLEIEKLRTQVGKLEQQQAATGLAKQNAIALAETEATNPPLSSEDTARRREALVKAHKGILENNLRQEQKDAQWAENAQAKLSSTYSVATSKGVRFVDADCRSTMCRLKMALDQPGKRGELQLRTLMDSPTPWPGTRFMQLDKQTGEVVVYMMRENHELPTLPPETVNN